MAKGLKRESYGLVFGINTFAALVLQTALTLVVTDGIGLALNPRQQFKVYGGYFAFLGAIFLSISFCRRKSSKDVQRTESTPAAFPTQSRCDD